MNGPHDTDGAATADAGGELDPQEAATLLQQTKTQARRQFAVNTPLLSLFQAAFVLIGYGTIWLSVRGQHPYTGPGGAALLVLYTLAAIVIVVVATVVQRATTGVSGRSQRERRVGAVPVVAALLAVYVLMGALLHDGASHAIVYGVFAAAAPLIVVGAAIAGGAAAREDWSQLGTAITVIVIGAGSAFAGPTGVWGILALVGSIALISRAAAQIWRRRA